jgi:hypothetical protein
MNELAKFTTDQLKVMAYDASDQLTMLRQQIEIINQEIQKRRQEKSQVQELEPTIVE